MGRKCNSIATGAVLGLLVVIMSVCGGCTGSAVMRSTAKFSGGSGFTRHDIVVDGKVHSVWVFVPKGYQPNKRYPAILFLHGLFEASSSGSTALSAGLGPVIAEAPEKWPFITIFPQSTGTWRGEARERLAIGALDYAQARWSIDGSRVILAGLSYGGLGTWEIGSRHPERFAALVPVSGHSATSTVQRVILLPVWAFAYTGDPFVKSGASEEMCAQITNKGGKARLTEFAGVGHDAWDKAVNESALVPWMLAQRRKAPTTPAAGTALANID